MRTLPLLLVLLAVLSGAAWLWFSTSVHPNSSVRATDQAIRADGSRSAAALSPGVELVEPELPDARDEQRQAAADAAPERPQTRAQAVALEEPEGQPIVRGQVLDELGRPMKDAPVTLWVVPTGIDELPPMIGMGLEEQMRRKGKKKKGVSAEDGRFELKIPTTNRELDLEVAVPGFELKTLQLGTPAKLPVEVGELQLVPGCIIRGLVTDEHGEPLARASIRIEHPEEGPQDLMGLEQLGIKMGSGPRTGRDGSFEYLHEPAGDYVLHVDHKERPEQKFEGSTRAGETLELRLVLPDGGRIAGHVLDLSESATGVIVQARRAPELVRGGEQPSAQGEEDEGGMLGAVFSEMGMSSGDHWTKVEADGSFLLEGLDTSGGYMVWIAEPHRQFFMREAVSDEYEAWVGEQDLRIPYEEGVRVQMQIVDARDKQPVREFTVSSQLGSGRFPARKDEQTDREGRITLDRLRPKGEGKLLHFAVRAKGYKIYRDHVVVPEKGELQLGKLLLQPTQLLKVQVLREGKRAPVAEADVVLVAGEKLPRSWRLESRGPATMSDEDLAEAEGDDRKPRRGTTDERGRCELNSFPGEPSVLIVSGADFATQRFDLSLPLEGDLEQEVLVSAGGTAMLQVVDSEGYAAPKARVEQLRPWSSEDDLRVHTADDLGGLTLTQLAPGEHRFRARQQKRRNMGFRPDDEEQGGRGEWVTATIAEGEPVELTLVLPVFGSLSGVVTEAGEALPGATLALLRDNERSNRRVVIEGMEQWMAVSRDTSDESGRFALENVAAGKYLLRVRHPERAMPTTIEIELEEGPQERDIELAATLIEGRITRDDGEPVSGANVKAIPAKEAGQARLGLGFLFGGNGSSSASAQTDADGRYALRGLTAGEKVVVRAEAKQHSPASTGELLLMAGERKAGVDLVLMRSGLVSVHVQGGRPFHPVRAFRLDASGGLVGATNPGLSLDLSTPQRVQLTRHGTAVFDDLDVGRWKIEVDDAEAFEIAVEAGKSQTFTIEVSSN